MTDISKGEEMKNKSRTGNIALISLCLWHVIVFTGILGCGASTVVFSPDYNDELFRTSALKRPNVEFVNVIDKRNSPPNEIGSARTGLEHNEVPCLFSVRVDEFVKDALDSLVVMPVEYSKAVPVTVYIDIFQVGERNERFTEVGFFMCKLRFVFPIRADSLMEVAVRSEQVAKSASDITNSLEKLVYKGIEECVKKFVNGTIDKQSDLFLKKGN